MRMESDNISPTDYISLSGYISSTDYISFSHMMIPFRYLISLKGKMTEEFLPSLKSLTLKDKMDIMTDKWESYHNPLDYSYLVMIAGVYDDDCYVDPSWFCNRKLILVWPLTWIAVKMKRSVGRIKLIEWPFTTHGHGSVHLGHTFFSLLSRFLPVSITLFPSFSPLFLLVLSKL